MEKNLAYQRKIDAIFDTAEDESSFCTVITIIKF